MLSRSQHTSVIGRAAAMRRLRRRATVSTHLFCSTNGCASFLEIDADGRQAVCPICGYRRLLN
jgi:DNA-directed RNA polymerase subunit RPC12/RpoP